ncbi:hypothetical protein BJP27_14905 [Pseudomonas oryzihabitans]|nr:hypothetical protein BJP27_14905 [Pseudomonas psychrotolerans]
MTFSEEKEVVVHVHKAYGPYIRVENYKLAGLLEDFFDEKYYVLYWKSHPDDLKSTGGCEYYFGGAANPKLLNEIIKEIMSSNGCLGVDAS